MECGQEDENDTNDGCETNVWLILPWVLAVRHLCGCVCVGGVSGIRGSIMCVAGLELEGLKTAGLLLSVLLLKLE